MKKLKILVVIPPFTSLPAKGHGGTERIAEGMISEFLKKGHEVTLIGCGESITQAKFVQIFHQTLDGKDFGAVEASRPLRIETAYITKVMKYLQDNDGKYDVVFNHMRGGYLLIPMQKYLQTPIISTFHLPLFDEIVDALSQFEKTNCVTISQHQQKIAGDKVNFAGIAHDGLDPEKYFFTDKSGGYLLFIGAIGEHKGPHLAIEAAKKSGEKLILAGGKVREPYFSEKIKPHIDNSQISYIGEVDDDDQKARLYCDAKALLFPVVQDEAFGLVIIESMISGTPVIAFDKGATREIIDDNRDGFIVKDVDEMVQRIKQIKDIDRHKCREKVLQKFTYEKMAEQYLQIYQSTKQGGIA